MVKRTPEGLIIDDRDALQEPIKPLQNEIKDGEPCTHKGCLSHVSHPCEGCGRIAGRGSVKERTSYGPFYFEEDFHILPSTTPIDIGSDVGVRHCVIGASSPVDLPARIYRINPRELSTWANMKSLDEFHFGFGTWIRNRIREFAKDWTDEQCDDHWQDVVRAMQNLSSEVKGVS